MLFDARQDQGLLASAELETMGHNKTAQVARQIGEADLSGLSPEYFCVRREDGGNYFPAFDVDSARVSAVYLRKHASELTVAEAEAATAHMRKFLPAFSIEGGVKEASFAPCEDEVLREFFGDAPEATSMDKLASLRVEGEKLTPKGKRDLAEHLSAQGGDALKTAAAAIDDLEDYAGDEVGSGFSAAVLMRKVAFAEGSREAEILESFRSDVLKGHIKAADAVGVLEAFDRRYPPEAGVPDPYQSVYRQKEASDSRAGLRDKILSKRAQIEQKWGESVAEQISRDPLEVFDSLPHPMQQEILEL